MREIKFRAWYNNGMYYNVLVGGFPCSVPSAFVGDCENEEWRHLGSSSSGEDSAKLMQFTGLKDKNGKEIYEGDIVLSKYFDNRIDKYVKRKAKVMFERGCFLVKNGYWTPLLTNIIGDTWALEIIGNIYENPELLK